MNRRLGFLITLAAPLLLLQCAPARSSENVEAEQGAGASSLTAASGPSIDGTYRLAYRRMSDGTRQEPPMIEGLMNFTDGYRNLNILEHDAQGIVFTVSEMCTYTFTDSLYSQTMRYEIQRGLAKGSKAVFEENRTGSSPVTLGADGSISFTFPEMNLPATFTADSLTIKASGFVDHWVKVKPAK